MPLLTRRQKEKFLIKFDRFVDVAVVAAVCAAVGYLAVRIAQGAAYYASLYANN